VQGFGRYDTCKVANVCWMEFLLLGGNFVPHFCTHNRCELSIAARPQSAPLVVA